MSSQRQRARLELFPTEILHVVVEHLLTQDLKYLSRVSEQLRKICMPYLFRNVRFSFSNSGFDKLRRLLESHVRQYVVSFTYVIPELLQPGKAPLHEHRNSY
jgi:hypothetical protein